MIATASLPRDDGLLSIVVRSYTIKLMISLGVYETK